MPISIKLNRQTQGIGSACFVGDVAIERLRKKEQENVTLSFLGNKADESNVHVIEKD